MHVILWPLLALLAGSLVTPGQGAVTIQLETKALVVPGPGGCDDGAEDLTNTSILLHYRSQSDQVENDWVFLAVLPSNKYFSEEFEVTDNSNIRFQLRLLQTSHGGGGCSCWWLIRSRVIVQRGNSQPRMVEIGEDDKCSKSPDADNFYLFCDGLLMDPRGLITKIFVVTGMNVDVATEGSCPVGSNILSYGAPVNVLPTTSTIVGSSAVPAPTSAISSLSSTFRDESLSSFESPTPNPTSFLTPSQSSVIVTSPTSSPFSAISQPQSSSPSSLLHIQSQFSSTRAPTALTPFTSLQSSPSVYLQSSFSSISSLSSFTPSIPSSSKSISLESSLPSPSPSPSISSSSISFESFLPAPSPSPSRSISLESSLSASSPSLPSPSISFPSLFNPSPSNPPSHPSSLQSSLFFPSPSTLSLSPLSTSIFIEPSSSESLFLTTQPGPSQSEILLPLSSSSVLVLLQTSQAPFASYNSPSHTQAIRPQPSPIASPSVSRHSEIPSSTLPPQGPSAFTSSVLSRLSSNFEPVRSSAFGTTSSIVQAATSGVQDSSSSTVSSMMREPVTETPSPTPPAVPESLSLQQAIEVQINRQEFSVVLKAEPAQAIGIVRNLTQSVENLESVVVLYLLSDILNRLERLEGHDVTYFIERLLEIIDFLITNGFNLEVDIAVVGGSILNILDEVAFRLYPDNSDFSTNNIVGVTALLSLNDITQSISTINSMNYPRVRVIHPQMSIEVPVELLQIFGGRDIRTASFLYFNVENLFPNGEDNSTLASGIVSTALQCGTGRCPTDNLTLNTPVIVTIQHSEELKQSLARYENVTTECVFWEFSLIKGFEETLLRTGQWSDRGCMKNERLSNVSVTVCECDHLTHFAILLSPAPINASAAVIFSLQVIGYVGMSVSLVAMAATVITFVILKSLRNMRNYIHINLCISLGIAQIIFVAGIDQSSPDGVPIHCRAIAVLLHYFFLVSFMWMLMEGVVLYVVLVRVFVKRTKMYMLAFTLASYGIPLLYLGALTLPLGFALDGGPYYGYNQACFLNPETHFIWAFISPVILTILLNFVFLIIVARVAWKHQKKNTENTTTMNVKKWLRSVVSLVVVMGITWIFGVLIVEVEALLPLAYIYTILVAFQGLWIFLIFVLFSPQVRDAYTKWWRAKVNDSDFLSKYLGDTMRTLPQSTIPLGQISSSTGVSPSSGEERSSGYTSLGSQA